MQAPLVLSVGHAVILLPSLHVQHVLGRLSVCSFVVPSVHVSVLDDYICLTLFSNVGLRHACHTVSALG